MKGPKLVIEYEDGAFSQFVFRDDEYMHDVEHIIHKYINWRSEYTERNGKVPDIAEFTSEEVT